MTTSSQPSKPTNSTKPHIVTREFEAPRELVRDVCTQPGHLAAWFAPGGRKGSVKSFDFRVGGMIHYCQTAPDGSDPGWPRVMHCIYRFEDLGKNRTRFTVEWTPADDSSAESIALFDSARAGMDGGWKGTLDNLENYIKTIR